ncbi:MAG: sigma-70 family RNA polymerase sigma factor [Myxococcales bacterium]|nr:sigma-70 family RNA polymerase sigma factor [Myxococcales bacterium]MCB9712941.1 sigma-70 family RNA polymerase sigma factor [Myxococcales bacterium]
MHPSFGGTNHGRTGPPPVPDGSRSFDPGDPSDPSALSAIYRAHSAYVWRVLRHCGVADDDLDDAVQETFLVVFRRLGDFRGQASLRTWIYAVAVRVASTRRRSERREAARRERAGAQLHGDRGIDPEDALARAEAARLVDDLLDELDPPKRTVFVLAEIEGVKVPEIARILGVNPRTVHSRLRLARERFGTALRRLQAREHGNRRVSRLRPRAVLEAAAADRPPAKRRKAAAAAVMARLEQGAMPTLGGWQTIAPSSGASLTAPAIVGAVAAAAGLSWVVATAGPSTATAPRQRPAEAAQERSQGSTSARPVDAPAEVPEPEAIAEAPPRTEDEPARAPRPRAVRRAVASPSAADPEGIAEPSVSTLAEETRVLELARASLSRGDANAALAVLDDYQRRFGAGVLADEARSTRLRALCAAGRVDDAWAQAERWSPGPGPSRWGDVVAAACGPR